MSAIYRALCGLGDRLVYPLLPRFARPAWDHPAGPKTVFFWAPTIKWILIGAGLADLARPAHKLSVYQNTALMFTGAIWTRYCLVIIPVNYYLASVNFFVGCTGATQLLRVAYYHHKHPHGEEAIGEAPQAMHAVENPKALVSVEAVDLREEEEKAMKMGSRVAR